MANKQQKVNARFYKAEVKDLSKEVAVLDLKLPIYKNGIDNLYPERIERIIDSSPTAKASSKKMRKYIIGRGINEFNNKEINGDGQEFFQFLTDIGDSYCRHKGAFIHIKYKAEAEFDKTDESAIAKLKFVIDSWKVIPYQHCRVGKKDDKGWFGKIAVFENWDTETNPDESKVKLYNAFNPKQEVIKEQINKVNGDDLAQKIKNYQGQILFFNPENSIYPLAHIDPAYHDADTEHRMAIYKNTSIREGFMGVTFAVTPPLEGEFAGASNAEIEKMDDLTREKYENIQSQSEETSQVLQSSLGAENSGRMIHIQLETGDDFDKMEDSIFFKSIESNIKPEMFKEWESSCPNNIRKAFNSIPAILLERNEGSLFGNSGEMLKQAKLAYQEDCEEDKMLIEGLLKKLFKYTPDFKDKAADLEPLIKEEMEGGQQS